jgi:hypothetical protein
MDFHMADGSVYCMHHIDDCCEAVYIEDIDGDPSDIRDARVLTFEEPSGETYDAIAALHGVADRYKSAESYTWTFYRLNTDKGGLCIRWIGESNGFYSEGVDFECVVDPRLTGPI